MGVIEPEKDDERQSELRDRPLLRPSPFRLWPKRQACRYSSACDGYHVVSDFCCRNQYVRFGGINEKNTVTNERHL